MKYKKTNITQARVTITKTIIRRRRRITRPIRTLIGTITRRAMTIRRITIPRITITLMGQIIRTMAHTRREIIIIIALRPITRRTTTT